MNQTTERVAGVQEASAGVRALERIPQAPRGGLRMLRLRNQIERPSLWIAAVVLVGIVWWLIAHVIDEPLLLPGPFRVVRAAWELYVTGPTIYQDLLTSLKEAGVGFAIALVGVPLGLIIGSSQRLSIMFEPINAAMYSLPHIALVPIAIVWFGLGTESKVFMVFISTVFTILIATSSGVSTVSRELNDVAITFGAARMRRFATVTVPGTVPFIMTGLRLSIGRALVGVVAAELFAANKGLGYLLGIYGNSFQTAKLFVVIATFAAVGGAMSVVVGFAERWFNRWKVN